MLTARQPSSDGSLGVRAVGVMRAVGFSLAELSALLQLLAQLHELGGGLGLLEEVSGFPFPAPIIKIEPAAQSFRKI